MEAWLKELNPHQRAAAEQMDGPVIILAGAGSGKTKMLTTRVVQLIQNSVPAHSILAVTFTNKAANEMKQRVSSILEKYAPQACADHWGQPWMGFSHSMPEVSTFHSFCVKLLRQEMEYLGYQRPFVIYDDGDQHSLLKKIIKELNLSGTSSNVRAYQAAINKAKTNAWGPEDLENEDMAYNPIYQRLPEVYQIYQNRLRENEALDFGDLLVKAYELLRDHPAVLEKYQEIFKYIMVDEYQDTNRAQYLIISILAKKYRNLCVVGDEDQSIYKWRGADIRNILDFQSEYQEAKMFKLEQNYRSTKTIIEAASAVIENNDGRYKKELWTDNHEGEKVRLVNLNDERMESDFVSQEIQAYLRQHQELSYNDVAVFYRGHAQSRALEESLRKMNIPYRIIGGLAFYDRKEIKDVVAFLRVLVNPDDSMSLLRIINVPARGIGKTTLDKLDAFAREQGISLYKGITTSMTLGGPKLSKSVYQKLSSFLQFIQPLMDHVETMDVSELFQKLLEDSGYLAELQTENTFDSQARIENLEEFSTVIQNFESEFKKQGLGPKDGMLANFLNQLSLESQVLVEEEQATSRGSVSMMTLHASKGLEFPLVFVCGCEEGIFPSKRAIDSIEASAIEEERRLCYVGMTRAEKYLVMTSVGMRRIHGQMQVSSPSRFLTEIPSRYVQMEDKAQRNSYQASPNYGASSKKEGVYYDYSESQELDMDDVVDSSGRVMHIGSKVLHDTYGMGTIRKLEGTQSNRKVTVEFKGYVQKKFMLKFVQLELVD